MSSGRALVVMPTYNERDSLPVTLAAVHEAAPAVEVLVVDDNSPDGTGQWAEAQAQGQGWVHVLHREEKTGLGRAYVAGFRWALARGYERIVEMDADGSHRPTDLPALLAAADDSSVAMVIGSRWVPGGAVQRWPRRRELLSRVASLYARVAIGLPVRDTTAGFRVYPASTLAALPLGEITSQGYCFQIDMTRRVNRCGGRILEVPITFVERTQGSSKMDRSIVFEALWKVGVWGLAERARQLRQALRRRA